MALEPRLLRRARSSLYNHMGCLGRWVAMRWYNALEGCVGLGLPCSCMEALYGMRGSIEGLILGLLPSFVSRHHCGSGQQMCWHAAGALHGAVGVAVGSTWFVRAGHEYGRIVVLWCLLSMFLFGLSLFPCGSGAGSFWRVLHVAGHQMLQHLVCWG